MIASVPSLAEIEEEKGGDTLEAIVVADVEANILVAALRAVDDALDAGAESYVARAVEPVVVAGAERRDAPMGAGPKIDSLAQTVRIDVSKLDALINLVGELVVDRTREAQVSRALQVRYKEDEQVRARGETSTHFSKVIDVLHESMMQSRMLPVGVIFSKFPRLVRDLARTMDRQIALEVKGEDTEIDRPVIEEINAPIVHLIRNSVDHGIESAEDRLRLRHMAMGVFSLADVLKRVGVPTTAGARRGDNYVVVVRTGESESDRTVALPLDKLIDQQEIVVKSLSGHLGRVHGIAGATRDATLGGGVGAFDRVTPVVRHRRRHRHARARIDRNPVQEETYAQLKRQIARFLDLDIDAYKQRQMRRRLDTWVEQNARGDEEGFVRSLGTRSDALKDLRDTLTINVTEFFRDQAQWTELEQTVLPQLIAESPRLKIWSAGCSSGDEPYSVAMLLDEARRGATASILATDLDPGSLEKAKAGGPYMPDAIKNVASERLKYFREEERRFYVVDTLRQRIQYRPLNLLKDSFGSGYDLILCRNVTIYFDPPIKAALTRRFHEALRPGGVLFIGATEALLGAESAGFTRTTGNFYRKDPVAEPRRVRRAA